MYKGSFKVVLRSILFAFILSFLVVTFVNASIYMPNNRHDQYTYINQFGGTSIAKVDHSSCNWQHWTEFASFGPVWVWTFKANEYVYLYANGRIQLFVNFKAPVGSRRLVNIGPCNQKVYAQLAARNEQVTVPAGTFEDCIRIDLETSCEDGGTISIWFAPKVGVVKWISQSIAGPKTWELKKGIVGGIEYPKPVSMAVTVQGGTDQFEYIIDMMPPIDPEREPTLLHGKFTISNKSGRTIDFNTGLCEFNIYIYNEEGTMVSHMNRGNDDCNKEVLIKKTLEDGETWDFSGEVELTDEKGDDLLEGDYTVECVLEATPRFSTSHTIKILYTY